MPGEPSPSDPSMMGNRTGSSDSNHEKDKEKEEKAKEKVPELLHIFPSFLKGLKIAKKLPN